MKKIVKTAFFMAAAVFCAGGTAVAQDTVFVPVTFYDFHSDRSNPEFEQPHGKGSNNGRWLNMVAGTLDNENKPRLGSEPYRNYGIAHWFRDWNTYTAGPYAKGKNMAPSYDPAPPVRERYSNEWDATVVYNGDVNVGHDTSFKNIVLPGTLPFTSVANRPGMFQFSRRGSSGFFWIDGRGFGNEWVSEGSSSHNFAFTMEMVYPFDAKPDMKFNFTGDDDVWVFIDANLVLDIGGIHSEVTDSFNLSNVLTNPTGMHTLRVFYAERHSSASNILIQTNIVSLPASITITGSKDSSRAYSNITNTTVDKSADSVYYVRANMRDENGNAMTPGVDYQCDHITWKITRPDGKTETGKGCDYAIRDSVAVENLIISATYQDPSKKDLPPVSSIANMTIHPIQPAYIVVQKTPERKPAAAEDKSDDIYFRVSDSAVTAYAVLYDKYGNYVPWGGRYNPNDVVWSSSDPDVAAVRGTPSSGTASAVVTKREKGEGDVGELTASYRYTNTLEGSKALTDTVDVGSKGEPSIAIGPNPFIPGRTKVSDAFPPDSKVYDFYREVPGVTSGYGVLIAAEAAKPLTPGPVKNGVTSYGKVVIYDAVGNIVRVDALYGASGARRAYGFVWDGKNMKGRNVGPGTYLVRVTGKDTEGNSLKIQKKVGVTK